MTRTLLRTPKADGYWMPGEFDRHAGTWMLWPERLDNWRLGAIPAQRAFAAVAAAIAGFEPVCVGASGAQYAFARAGLDARVRVVEMSSNDAWMRDVGPTFVVNVQCTGIDAWSRNGNTAARMRSP
jgi:agmatine deiminase